MSSPTMSELFYINVTNGIQLVILYQCDQWHIINNKCVILHHAHLVIKLL